MPSRTHGFTPRPDWYECDWCRVSEDARKVTGEGEDTLPDGWGTVSDPPRIQTQFFCSRRCAVAWARDVMETCQQIVLRDDGELVDMTGAVRDKLRTVARGG